METLDILFWVLVGALGLVTVNPFSWGGSKPVEVKQKPACRCFWCS